jgi:hypothetical protein
MFDLSASPFAGQDVLVHGTEGRDVFLLAFGHQTIRTETGMPSPVIRLRTLHPIFASVR